MAKMNFKLKVFVSLLCITGFSVLWRVSLLEFPQLQKKSCTCDKCLSDHDQWLLQRLSKSVDPFLSENHNLSEDAFNWWKQFQDGGNSYNNYVTAVNSLFQMFPSSPDVTKPSPGRCRSCAVVGNSGNLKGSHYGALIDYYDIVIRMNYGRTKGYEEDVGTKTTHRVMYPESASYLDDKTHLVLFPFKIRDLLWLVDTFTPKGNGAVKKRANKDLVMILNPAFMKYVHEIWLNKKGSYPSTGFMTVVLSMQMCDEVSVFGFGADRDGNWNHYFEVLRNKKLGTGYHPGKHEYEVIQTLHQQQIIQFFKGW